ncbi:MAG: ABC transporter ATP-binding protein [Spirochaetales bacterium]|nr:ABC transporter ATP-binding protein [Spirochaetales bacterium]
MSSLIRAEEISYRYNRGPEVFRGISFDLDEGEIFTILGANGAGKSTLLNCLAGIFKPKSGRVFLNAREMGELTHREIAKLIAFVPQIHNPTYGYSVREYVVMGTTPYIGAFASPRREDYRTADQAIERMNVAHLADKAYTDLSGGERQQVTIARALAQRPRLIMLDEPTAHLDYGNQLKMIKLIKTLCEEGFAVVLTTHVPDHPVILDGRVGILTRSGGLITGGAETLLTDESLTALYGIEIRMKYLDECSRRICYALFDG